MEVLSHREFIEHYETHGDAVFRLCLVKTGDRETALDLTQETFIKVWEYSSKGNSIDNLRAFTFTVARNLIKDFYKKKKSILVGSLDELELVATLADVHASEEDDPVKELEEAAAFLDRLEEADREILELRIIEQLSPQQIAERLDLRENTVAVRIHRALKRYREILTEHYEH